MVESKTIKGKRLILEPFSERFLTARYINWLNDPEVVRFSEQRHRRHTAESCKANMESLKRSPHYFWAIVLEGRNSEHIGNIAAYIDPPNRFAELSILIGEKREWGKGYGTEAWCMVCNHLLGEKEIRKVAAGTLSVNKAMIGVMEKAGMIDDGYRNRQLLWDGKEVDIIYKAIFNENLQ